MNISPLGDIVIIRRSAPAEVSAGGIHLIWDDDYREDIGVIAFAGSKVLYVKPGDKVLFSTNGHQITTINGEELVVLREKSIIGIIEGGDVEAGTYKEDRQYRGIE